MSRVPLGHLRRLNPRDAWANEATDFTPWLAAEDNFRALADTLHFTDAEVEDTERGIGSFSADLIARDRDGLILIENQLEQTDHGHLGQVLTYLAGLDEPAKVVWISTKVREEHRAAIDWLNANTPSEFAFFAVELEVFQIGDGPAAPHFHVAARPNEWSRHQAARSREAAKTAMSEGAIRNKAFWTGMAERLSVSDPSVASLTPPKGHWWDFSIGRSGFVITLVANTRDALISVELFSREDPDKQIIGHLQQERVQIEQEMGERLEWEPLEGKKGSRIVLRKRNCDPTNTARWDEYAAWYADTVERFRQAFRDRVKAIDLEALVSPPETSSAVE